MSSPGVCTRRYSGHGGLLSHRSTPSASRERSSKSTLTSLIHRDKLVVGSWSGVVFMDGEFTESVSPIGPSATRCESPAVRSTVYRYGERIMSFRAVFRLNGRWRKLYEGDLLTERSLRHHRQAARTRAGASSSSSTPQTPRTSTATGWGWRRAPSLPR